LITVVTDERMVTNMLIKSEGLFVGCTKFNKQLQ